MQTLDEVRAYLLAKTGTSEDYPFGDNTAVFRVAGRLFALVSINAKPLNMNLKCNPMQADALRSMYKCIIPGYHMNKKHWNTVTFAAELPDDLLEEMIDNSYDLVVAGLPKAVRESLDVSGDTLPMADN